MTARDHLFLFIAFAIGIFILWAVLGDFDRPEESRIEATEEKRYLPLFVRYVYRGGGGSTGGSSATREPRGGLSETLARSQGEVERLEKQLEEIRLWGVRSPYEGLVRIEGRGGARYITSNREYIQISASRSSDTEMNVTGWRLVSAVTGNYTTIGSASTMPGLSAGNIQSPVLLSPGAGAYILSGRSPLNTSFQPNKCMGYLVQFQAIYPSLSRQCPRPIDELKAYPSVPTTDDRCYDFVKRLGQCQTLRSDLLDQYELSRACDAFLEHELGYSACVRKHASDADFRHRVWYVYGGSVPELWRQEREIIRLLDREGRTVDVISY